MAGGERYTALLSRKSKRCGFYANSQPIPNDGAAEAGVRGARSGAVEPIGLSENH